MEWRIDGIEHRNGLANTNMFGYGLHNYREDADLTFAQQTIIGNLLKEGKPEKAIAKKS